jgi:ribosomal protein L31
MGRLISRKVHKESFTAVAVTTTTNINQYLDLSNAEALTLEVKITAAGAAAGDILNVSLEDTVDGSNWNTRIRFDDLLGNMTEPEIRRASIIQIVSLASTEEMYETTGSTGATETPEGSVVNGPFPGICRTSSGITPAWRIVYEVTSASAPSFTGTATLIATTRC